MRLANISLLGKIGLLVAVFGIATVGGTIYSTHKMRTIDDTYGNLIDGYGRANLAMARANRNLVYVDRSLFRLLTETGDERSAARQETLDSVTLFHKQIKAATRALPDEAETFALLDRRMDTIVEGPCSQVLNLATEAKAAEIAMRTSCDPIVKELMNDISGLTSKLLKATDAASDATQATTTRSITETYGMILGALAGVLAIALFAARFGVSRPMGEIVETLDKLSRGATDLIIPGVDRGDEIGDIARAAVRFREQSLEAMKSQQALAAVAAKEQEMKAEMEQRHAAELARVIEKLGEGLRNLAMGDLSAKIKDGFGSEYARLRDDFNEAIEQLSSVVRNVVDRAHFIQTEADGISASAEELAARTTEQASSVEQTAGSLDEVTKAVRHAAASAVEAKKIVASADEDARYGASVMSQTIEAMNAIGDATSKIANIISVIDSITFQTNLLALNAGVEAARTGEAGKGFAVIAGEVRKLAQHSADASQEVKRLIAQSTASVDSGAKLVQETNQALGRIAARVAEVNNVVAAIAEGAEAQAGRLGDINEAVSEIDQVTQKNADMVSQSSTTSQSLVEQTQALAQLVSKFRTTKSEDIYTERKPRQFAA